MGAPVETSAKTSCFVHLYLADGRTQDAVIYLLPNENRPGGLTPLEEILDGSREFIPVGLQGGRSALVSVAAICAVEVHSDEPGLESIPGEAGSFDVVTLKLASGVEITGVLRGLGPMDTMRTSDLFNAPGRFVAVDTGHTLILVSKSHLVQASF